MILYRIFLKKAIIAGILLLFVALPSFGRTPLKGPQYTYAEIEVDAMSGIVEVSHPTLYIQYVSLVNDSFTEKDVVVVTFYLPNDKKYFTKTDSGFFEVDCVPSVKHVKFGFVVLNVD